MLTWLVKFHKVLRMQVFIGLESLQIQRSLTDSRALDRLNFKRGDAAEVVLIFVRNGVAEEITTGSVITFCGKPKGKYDGVAAILHNEFTLSGSGETAKYTGQPSFNTEPLNDAMMVDGDDSNDLDFIDLIADISWKLGDDLPTSTANFIIHVENDVFRGDEDTPAALPDPTQWMPAEIGTTAPTNAATAVAYLEFHSENNPDIGTPVTIGTVQYTFVASATVPGDVELGAISVDTATNLNAAVNGDSLNDPNPDVVAIGVGSGPTVYFEAAVPGAAGNDIVFLADNVPEYFPNLSEYFTGGADQTATPPYLRAADGYFYIQEAGVWKKAALEAL